MTCESDWPRVAFNLMSARLGGGLTYAISQTKAFLEIWPSDRIVILTSPWNDHSLQRALQRPTVCLSARSALHRYLIEQTLPVSVLRKERVDVLYGIANFLPLTPIRCGTVMTLQNPNYVGEGRRLHHNATFGERMRVRLCHASMKRADLVITISKSLDDALRTEKTLVNVRTRTILSGGPEWTHVYSDPALSASVGSAPFFLSVANDYPHKRLDDIARAFATTSATSSARSMNLVFAGTISSSRQQHLRSVANAHAERLIFLGPVSERGRIKWLFENAAAALSASELEAFPLTPAEAASLRCPLVLTAIPPHLEVAEGAGLLFETGDVPALAKHMVRIAGRTMHTPTPAWTWPATWNDNAARLADAISEVAVERSTRSRSD